MKAVGKGVIVNTKHILLLQLFLGSSPRSFLLKFSPFFFLVEQEKEPSAHLIAHERASPKLVVIIVPNKPVSLVVVLHRA